MEMALEPGVRMAWEPKLVAGNLEPGNGIKTRMRQWHGSQEMDGLHGVGTMWQWHWSQGNGHCHNGVGAWCRDGLGQRNFVFEMAWRPSSSIDVGGIVQIGGGMDVCSLSSSGPNRIAVLVNGYGRL